VIKRLGFNRSYYLASVIFAVGCVGWYYAGLLELVQLALYRRRRLRDDLGGGGKRAGLQRHFAEPGRLLAAYMMIYYVGRCWAS
jgi:UMF2 family putative MFS family transporter